MRKLLSVLLSVIIAVLSVSQGFSSFAQENEKKKLYTFAEELSNMVRKSDVDIVEKSDEDNIEEEIVKADVFYSNSVETDFADLPDNAFETQRLIVKSKKSIDYQGAIDCVSGYNDLYIMQYDSVFTAKMAYKYYLSCDYIDYVEPDVITCTCVVNTLGKTGVEMEALTAATVAALTIYDMCKAVDKRMVIEGTHLLKKTGGKSGEFNFFE